MRSPGYYWCKCESQSSHPEIMRWSADGWWWFAGRKLRYNDGAVEVLSNKLEPPMRQSLPPFGSIKPHPILILQDKVCRASWCGKEFVGEGEYCSPSHQHNHSVALSEE